MLLWLFSLTIDGFCSWQLKAADMWVGIWESKGRMWLSPLIIQHLQGPRSKRKWQVPFSYLWLYPLLKNLPGVCPRLPSLGYTLALLVLASLHYDAKWYSQFVFHSYPAIRADLAFCWIFFNFVRNWADGFEFLIFFKNVPSTCSFVPYFPLDVVHYPPSFMHLVYVGTQTNISTGITENHVKMLNYNSYLLWLLRKRHICLEIYWVLTMNQLICKVFRINCLNVISLNSPVKEASGPIYRIEEWDYRNALAQGQLISSRSKRQIQHFYSTVYFSLH